MSFIRCIGQGWNWGTARPGAPGWKKQKNMSALWQHWRTYLLWLCKLIYLKYMATTSIQSCIINTYQSWICNMYWYAHLLANIVFQVGKSIMETLESERGIIPTKDDPKKTPQIRIDPTGLDAHGELVERRRHRARWSWELLYVLQTFSDNIYYKCRNVSIYLPIYLSISSNLIQSKLI